MALNVKDIIITSLETITAFDFDGKYLFTLDELQNASIGQTLEKVDITGRQGRKLSSLKRNKAVTISGTNGVISGGLLEMQTGSDFANKVTDVMWTDYIVVDSNHKSATSYVAIGAAGAEIDNLFIRNKDGTIGSELEQSDSAAAGKFAYDPETKELTFHTDVAKDTEIVVYYKRNIQADVLENDSAEYSKKCELYIDAIGEDKCANIFRIQFYIPKADFNGEFTFEMGDNQSVHAFEAEALSGACGVGGNFWTYTIFDDDAEDVTA